jgi:hypothetical protein
LKREPEIKKDPKNVKICIDLSNSGHKLCLENTLKKKRIMIYLTGIKGKNGKEITNQGKIYWQCQPI